MNVLEMLRPNEIAPGLTVDVLQGDRVAVGRNNVCLILTRAEAIGLAYWLIGGAR